MVCKVCFFPLLYLVSFNKPNIQSSLSNLKLVTKSTAAIIALIILNGFCLFLMFLGSNIPFFFFHLITRLQPLLCATETILEKLNFSISNGKKKKEEQFKWQNKQVKPPLINCIIAFFFLKKEKYAF